MNEKVNSYLTVARPKRGPRTRDARQKVQKTRQVLRRVASGGRTAIVSFAGNLRRLRTNEPPHRHTVTDAHHGLAVPVAQRRLHSAVEIAHLLCCRLEQAPSLQHRNDNLSGRKRPVGRSQRVGTGCRVRTSQSSCGAVGDTRFLSNRPGLLRRVTPDYPPPRHGR
jgi:hypothetical protein